MLLGSFLSPMRNKRTDEYGGSLDNRARLLFQVLDAIKEKCGRDFPVILRMSGSERNSQGNTLQDMLYLVPMLEKHGVDAFEISGGTQFEPVSYTHLIRAPYIEDAGPGTEILARVEGHIVGVRYQNQLAVSFHPEVTDDTGVHAYFLDMIRKSLNKT